MIFDAYVVRGKSGKASMVIDLDHIFPECKSLLMGTNLPRLSCWTNPNSCHKGVFTTCMGMVANRTHKIFMGMPELEIIVLHWKAPQADAPGGERTWGLVLERDESKEMKISTLNKWAVESIEKRIGTKFCINFDG
jgi:hypothetical protein